MNPELAKTVLNMLDDHDEKRVVNAIDDCHRGRIRYPVTTDNLHLFRRYRNTVSGDAKRLVKEAKEL